MIYRALLLAILTAFAGLSSARETKIGTLIEEDPCAHLEPGKQIRLRADFNNDGIPDVALSSDLREFGKMGGTFKLYLGTAVGKWRFVGEFFAHPLATQIEKGNKGEGILWLYIREGSHKGGLMSYAVSEHGIKELSSKEILTGDDDKDKGEYEKHFNDAAIIKAEIGTTVADKTTWLAYER